MGVNMSLRSVEKDIIKVIGTIAAILVTIAIISFVIAFYNAYQTGDTGSFVEWFASWFADNMIFAVYILIIAAFIGLISPKIAKALRDMSGF